MANRKPIIGVILAHCPTDQQWLMTARCLAAAKSAGCSALILVDNGSPKSWAADRRITAWATDVASLPTNAGFSAGCNAGLRFGEQKYGGAADVLLLNNDAFCSPGSARRLQEAARKPWAKAELETGWGTVPADLQPFIGRIPGLAGPIGPNVSGLQGVLGGGNARPTAPRTHLKRLVFYAVLLTAEALQGVGLLDEEFGLGSYEDDSYCRRCLNAGYLPALTSSAHVDHVGHATYQAMDPSMSTLKSLLETNKAIYDNLWAIDPKRVRPFSEGKQIAP